MLFKYSLIKEPFYYITTNWKETRIVSNTENKLICESIVSKNDKINPHETIRISYR